MIVRAQHPNRWLSEKEFKWRVRTIKRMQPADFLKLFVSTCGYDPRNKVTK